MNISRRYPARQKLPSSHTQLNLIPTRDTAHQRRPRATSQVQNLRVLEMAPRGQMYLHQKRLMTKPSRITSARAVRLIHRVISPLNPVATA